MVFGEIVEPSTRAYLNDEDDYTSNEISTIEWINTIEPPKDINTILLIESEFIIKLSKECLIGNAIKPICATKKNEISIYALENDKYIIICDKIEGVSCGEITEMLLPWIETSQNVYTLLSAPSAIYQNKNISEKPISFMRCLESKVSLNICPQLETPNLVSGIGANILSYSIHTGKKCALFIGYLDHAPMDSINSKPFTDLFKRINFRMIKSCSLQDKLPSNNLYM